MARKFLYVIAGLVMLIVAAGVTYTMFPAQLMRLAMVPSAAFQPLPPRAMADYARPDSWFARPGLAGDPTHWLPAGYKDDLHGDAAIFYIHPTTYLNRSHWNAPVGDARSNDLATAIVQAHGAALASAGAVWAPRYRQATFGAFLSEKPEAKQALDLAYADVLASWDAFLAAIPPTQPIIIAGHSQGSLHLLHLLHDRVAGQPVAKRIVAAYAIGWPVSLTADLPALGIPACAKANQANCLMSWQSFAEPADPATVMARFDTRAGYTGAPERDTALLCSNPVTGTPATAAQASESKGVIVPSLDLKTATFRREGMPTKCFGRGFLSVGAPPSGFGAFVMPGNNYHVFDYHLYWANIRADANRRLKAFEGR